MICVKRNCTISPFIFLFLQLLLLLFPLLLQSKLLLVIPHWGLVAILLVLEDGLLIFWLDAISPHMSCWLCAILCHLGDDLPAIACTGGYLAMAGIPACS